MSGTKEKQPKMTDFYSTDPSYMNDEFVELLWDNGPIVSQGQSSKPRKSSFHSVFAPCGSGVQENDNKDNPFPKIGHFAATEPKPNNQLPSSGMISAEDDSEIVRWINYPVEDSLHSDYYPYFLSDYSRVTTKMNTVPDMIKSSDSHNGGEGNILETTIIRSQPNVAVSNAKSSEVNIGGGSKVQEDCLMNFSNFSRPVALARANQQLVDLKSKKTVLVSTNNTTEKSVVESTSRPKSVFGAQDKCEEFGLDEQSKVKGFSNTCSSRSSEKIQSSSFETSAALGMLETDKGNETAVASSSMCSGSSNGTSSNDQCRQKKQHQEGEESWYLSEDHEDESLDLKKHAASTHGKGKKRSRAAEVHNLSERRRRDRINEKMRALQELIPNCNKTDKASMLDEAIEYLKTLQMQVQAMSMGSGLCMSPMMMHHPTMAHFSPMGMGMGMGVGLRCGMGMYDMHGSPFVRVPSIQGPRFACPSGYPQLPGSNGLQMLGIPMQGFPVPTQYKANSTTNSEDQLQQKKPQIINLQTQPTTKEEILPPRS